MDLTIWHNPRCTKSRQTLALLDERGLTPKIRLYLQDQPKEAEIRTALKALSLPAQKLLRRGEAPYKALALASADEAAVIAAMAAHPILIERPVVFLGTKAAIGRPPENVLDIL
jgi:arsenate reductase